MSFNIKCINEYDIELLAYHESEEEKMKFFRVFRLWIVIIHKYVLVIFIMINYDILRYESIGQSLKMGRFTDRRFSIGII